MPTSPIIQALFAFSGCAILFALWKGGPTERAAAAVVAANIALGVLVAEFLSPHQSMLGFANDGMTALALLAITLRRPTAWMGVVMLLYAGQFALHAYYMMSGRNPRDYLHALINNINFSAIIWCLIIGAAVAWRQRVVTERAGRAAGMLTPRP